MIETIVAIIIIIFLILFTICCCILASAADEIRMDRYNEQEEEKDGKDL